MKTTSDRHGLRLRFRSDGDDPETSVAGCVAANCDGGGGDVDDTADASEGIADWAQVATDIGHC